MTRTALKRNGLAEFRLRYTRQGAKAPFKTKECGKHPISENKNKKMQKFT